MLAARFLGILISGDAAMGPDLPSILIVEDEPLVRRFISRALRSTGYDVLEASGGIEALRVLDSHEGEIALVVLDVIMPAFGGLDFANELAVRSPRTKVLYVSGNTNSVALQSIEHVAPHSVLKKPFTAATVVKRVKN